MQDARMSQDDTESIFIQVEDRYWEMTGWEEGQGRADLLDAAHGRTGGWNRRYRTDRKMSEARNGMTMIAEIDEGKFWVYLPFMTENGKKYLFGNDTQKFLPPASTGHRDELPGPEIQRAGGNRSHTKNYRRQGGLAPLTWEVIRVSNS